MANVGEIIINILIVLLMLSVLVAIHEAGHLSMAKLFNVYCFEYSLGFGPKLFSRKRKKGETYFSLRALPFGGFVSMYGEKDVVPDDFPKPDDSRSLNQIAKWKKVLVLVAGVTMNFTLGLLLIFISCSCFEQYYSSYGATVKNESVYVIKNQYTAGTEVRSYVDDALIEYNARAESEGKEKASINNIYVLMPLITNYGYLLDDSVMMFSSTDTRVNPDIIYSAVYYPSTLVESHELSGCVRLYPSRALNESEKKLKDKFGIERLPNEEDMQKGNYYKGIDESDGNHFTLDLTLINTKDHAKDVPVEDKWNQIYENKINYPGVKFTYEKSKLGKSGVVISTIGEKLSFKESITSWRKKVPLACSAVVKGFGSLFTPGGFKNISGIIGITAAMPQLQASGGIANIFFYAGLISINLAFFNLLPFPALDGWAILVTAVEGIFKKKIPNKVQSIVSVIGFTLLMALMIAIMVKDVFMLV